MKSILIEKPNQLSIIEREIPTPSAGEVRVKVKLAGICGSDSHIYRGHNPFAKYPRVIGHEFFGVIDAVGEGVREDFEHLFGITHVFLDTEIGDPQIKVQRCSHADW